MSSLFGHIRGGVTAEADLVRMDRALAGPFDRAAGRIVRGDAALGVRAWTAAEGAVAGLRQDGPVSFAATGRVDNRRALLSALRRDGHRVEGGDDIDLLFAAYRLWGIDGLDRIAGSYCFAAWDGQVRRLVLVRSALVAPPLYYHQGADGRLAFATLPRGLFALPGITRRLDRHLLAMNLIRLSGPDPATLYQDVRRLPTGCVLICQGSASPVVRPWWRLDPQTDPGFDGDGADFALALRELLAEIVTEQMPDQGPTALLLSGGLDSAAIAALAAAGRPDRSVIGFTHVPRPDPMHPVPDGWCLDETDRVRAIAAQHPNLDARLLPTSTDYVLDAADAVTTAQERHFSNIGNLSWMMAAAARARESGARIMLTGTQGNLTISRDGGSPLLVALTEGRWRRAAQHLSARGALSVGLRLLPETLWRWQRGLRHHPLSGLRRPWRHFSVIRPAFADAQRIDDAGREWLETYQRRPAIDERPYLLHILQRQDIGLVDQALTSLHGVEYRHPLADIRIARFCLSAPNRLFHVGGQSRSAIRTAMRGLLPDTVLSNRLRGLQAADSLLRLRDHPAQLTADLARLDASPLAREVLDLPRLHAAARQLSAGDSAAGSLPTGTLVFGLAMGRFLCWLESEGVA